MSKYCRVVIPLAVRQETRTLVPYAFPFGEGGAAQAVTDEVAALQLRQYADRYCTSSTAKAVPLPQRGRLGTDVGIGPYRSAVNRTKTQNRPLSLPSTVKTQNRSLSSLSSLSFVPATLCYCEANRLD